MNEQYLTDAEVAQLTKIGLSTLRNQRCKNVGIPYVKFGRSVRYKLQDVINFLDSHKIKTRVS
jgi:excisionase family DNA binding protein